MTRCPHPGDSENNTHLFPHTQIHPQPHPKPRHNSPKHPHTRPQRTPHPKNNPNPPRNTRHTTTHHTHTTHHHPPPAGPPQSPNIPPKRTEHPPNMPRTTHTPQGIRGNPAHPQAIRSHPQAIRSTRIIGPTRIIQVIGQLGSSGSSVGVILGCNDSHTPPPSTPPQAPRPDPTRTGTRKHESTKALGCWDAGVLRVPECWACGSAGGVGVQGVCCSGVFSTTTHPPQPLPAEGPGMHEMQHRRGMGARSGG